MIDIKISLLDSTGSAVYNKLCPNLANFCVRSLEGTPTFPHLTVQSMPRAHQEPYVKQADSEETEHPL